MKCSKCNTEFSGKYCPSCGTKASKDNSGTGHKYNSKSLLASKKNDIVAVEKKEEIRQNVLSKTINMQKRNQLKLIIVCTIVSIFIVLGFALILWNFYIKTETSAEVSTAVKAKTQAQSYQGITCQIPLQWEKTESDGKVLFKTEDGGILRIFYDSGFLLDDPFSRGSILEGLKTSKGVDSLDFDEMQETKIDGNKGYLYEGSGVLLSEKTNVSVMMFDMPKGAMFFVFSAPENNEAQKKEFDAVLNTIIIDKNFNPEMLDDSIQRHSIEDAAQIPEGIMTYSGEFYDYIQSVNETADFYEVADTSAKNPEAQIIFDNINKTNTEEICAEFLSAMENVTKRFKETQMESYSGLWFCLRIDGDIIAAYHFSQNDLNELVLSESGVFDDLYTEILDRLYREKDLP